ncbi:uncharacterized protein RJT20DRAFT_42136 [Scheffersomyces xylosifermentans]|uniref:uncharacterized protein n=1 Tax=Scheffersomyces xylosifermentans TaxID=1304137 RepID=UPI00315DB026
MEHGITLKSAITGFFHTNKEAALATKKRVISWYNAGKQVQNARDPLANVCQIYDAQSSDNSTTNEEDDKRSRQISELSEIREASLFEFEQIHKFGGTYCRIVDSTDAYPDLDLPPTVFCKMYYSRQDWLKEVEFARVGVDDNSLNRKLYYDCFFHELEINEKIRNSKFTSNFPRLLASGCWNALPDRPMHIFEYLGKKLKGSCWDDEDVYPTIKKRLSELHSIGIVHKDISFRNILVSEEGKVSLIDFGFSYISSDPELQKKDLEKLDRLFSYR